MIFFITFLRMLAACLITNAHLTGVYPNDIIANGGLLGDVIFFAVSGYCLFSVKGNFFKWYGKRLWRIYLPVVLMTGIYLLLSFYTLESMSLFEYFVYPTYYHFVASIIVLYIPFYVIAKVSVLRKRLPLIMGIIALVALIVYVFLYNKSYYHIDTVREPFIRFLFMESMLLGAYFKQNDNKIRNRKARLWVVLSVVMVVLYFASKLLFSRIEAISSLQIINQIILIGLLYCLFRMFSCFDSKLEKMPKWIRTIITFISTITLEIYLVQYVLIDLLRSVGPFPLNWLAIVGSVILSAYLLHLVCKGIYFLVDKIIGKLKKVKE